MLRCAFQNPWRSTARRPVCRWQRTTHACAGIRVRQWREWAGLLRFPSTVYGRNRSWTRLRYCNVNFLSFSYKYRCFRISNEEFLFISEFVINTSRCGRPRAILYTCFRVLLLVAYNLKVLQVTYEMNAQKNFFIYIINNYVLILVL